MPAYGIDTSIMVRLLTGQPEVDYQTTVNRLTALRTSQPEHITVANVVIAEAYARTASTSASISPCVL